jgi:hypothetical protein
MNNFFGKKIEDFDAYEKLAISFFFHNSSEVTLQEIKDKIISLDSYKYVHYKDKWEVFVHSSIQLESCEYSGNLIIVSERMQYKFNQAVSKMCCGIHTECFRAISGRKYHIGFDYGH